MIAEHEIHAFNPGIEGGCPICHKPAHAKMCAPLREAMQSAADTALDAIPPCAPLAAAMADEVPAVTLDAAALVESVDALHERVAALEAERDELRAAAELAVRGFRRWKRNQKRGGDRYEGEHGLTDLGQGVYELGELLHMPY